MLATLGVDVRLEQARPYARGMYVACLPDVLERAVRISFPAVPAGLLATVVRDNPSEPVPGRLLELAGARDRLRPILLLLIDVDELAQRLHAVVRGLGKLVEKVLGTIEQTRAHIVLTELEQRLGALRGAQ